MPTLTGTVRAADQPARWAYVQVRNLAGDFQGEVRADADGRFTLYPRPGRAERDLDVDLADLDVDLELPGPSKRDGG